MAQAHDHEHPHEHEDYQKKINALEERVKKLEEALQRHEHDKGSHHTHSH